MFPCSLSFLPFLFSVCSGKIFFKNNSSVWMDLRSNKLKIQDDSANVARQQARDFPYKETAGNSKTRIQSFVYIFRYKKAISKK
jgi:hypothetical protein